MKPTVGRIVEYVLKDRYGKLQIRPAIIVRVWSDTCVQLQVFTDGTNDGPDYASGIYWATSVMRCENKSERTWDWMEYQKGQAKKIEELEVKLAESEAEESYLNHEPKENYEQPCQKDLGITQVRGAKANISDLQVYGDGDTFALLCKASSQSQGWMKSTKVANVPGGSIVQVTTQQRNPDGSYAVAEALTYVPGVHIDKESNPRKFIKSLA
jgi:hypothetical protein